jgi:hypothetical protein
MGATKYHKFATIDALQAPSSSTAMSTSSPNFPASAPLSATSSGGGTPVGPTGFDAQGPVGSRGSDPNASQTGHQRKGSVASV